jgi:Flp pilus assembly protein TadD
MHRLLARLGAFTLSTVALASCALAAPDSDHGAAQTAKRDDTMADRTNSGGLDSEIRSAQLSRQQGDYAGAVHALSQLMLMAPDDPRVVGEYGKVLAQQGRSAEAVQFLNRAIELQSGDWTLYSALGVAHDEAGDPAAAKAAYERALVLKPGEAAVLNNYAMSRVLAGDLTQARQLIAQASGSTDPKIARNAALIAGLTPPATVAKNAPVDNPEPIAQHTPTPLVAISGLNAPAQTVAAQPTPTEPKAGPAAKKHAPVKTAARKPAATPKLRKAANAAQIPALRLANDRP